MHPEIGGESRGEAALICVALVHLLGTACPRYAHRLAAWVSCGGVVVVKCTALIPKSLGKPSPDMAPLNATQCNAAQLSSTQPYSQLNSTQLTTQHSTAKHSKTQHNTTQHMMHGVGLLIEPLNT